LRWLSASFWQAGRELPFLIQDLTPRELRVPAGAATKHANGVSGIRELTITAADLDRISTGFGTLTGSAGTDFSLDRRRDAQITTFQLGRHPLVFAEATSPFSPIHHHIETTGLGPYEVTLATTSGGKLLLDTRRTHGARIWLV
jgi:hypothetical protein